MKKQFQILAVTLITVAFISCSKENIETPEMPSTSNEEIATSSSSNRPYIDPLTIGLDGRYTFDKHLKDATRQLADGKPSPALRGVPIYTYDRKGQANSALKFDGNYYVTIQNVPVQQNMSLSVWVKRGVTFYGGASPIIRHNSEGIALMQNENGFWARVHSYLTSETSSIISNDFIDDAWHHIVITFSADEMTMYVDGQLQTKTSDTFSVNEEFTKYLLGYSHGTAGAFWKGSIDDLRYYNRTLTNSDVQALFNL